MRGGRPWTARRHGGLLHGVAVEAQTRRTAWQRWRSGRCRRRRRGGGGLSGTATATTAQPLLSLLPTLMRGGRERCRPPHAWIRRRRLPTARFWWWRQSPAWIWRWWRSAQRWRRSALESVAAPPPPRCRRRRPPRRLPPSGRTATDIHPLCRIWRGKELEGRGAGSHASTTATWRRPPRAIFAVRLRPPPPCRREERRGVRERGGEA